MAAPATACVVCTEQVTAEFEALCMECGGVYHLQQRNDRPGKDCGQVWIDEDHLSLQFACDTCLNPEPEANLDDVLDLEEAAAHTGMTSDWLTQQAEAGAVKHRKTSSGTYLFTRRDLREFTRGGQA
jgi:hypothetical protein